MAIVSPTNDLSPTAAPREGWKLPPLVSGYGGALFGVVFTTVVLMMFRPWLEWGEVALLYLPLVIATASRAGFGPAVLAAAFSSTCCDYFFLPPYYSFTISPRGWVSLLVFMFVAIVTARLAARVREEAQAAAARDQETTMLYQASQAISSEVEADRLLPTLAQEVVRITGASQCAVLQYSPDDHSMDVVGFASSSGAGWQSGRPVEGVAHAVIEHIETQGLRERLELPEPTDPAECAGIYEPLIVQNVPMGVLYVRFRADGRPFTPQDDRVIRTMAIHASIVIARQQLSERSEERARETAILDERNRLARDMHDTLSHTFTGIKFLLEAADRVGPTQEALDCIAEARRLAVEGAQEARRSVLALRPAPLESAGDLAAAIRHLAGRQSAGGALDIEVEISGNSRTLPDVIEENLLRVCQEALANALRHASAEQVVISLNFAPDSVTLSILDDGSGFDPAAVVTGWGGGFGLTSMRQRCARIGADLKIDSRIGSGTEITVRTPINRVEL